MEVRHEPPSPDTMFRLHAPLQLGFPDGTGLRIDNWSLRALYSKELADRPLSGLILSIPFHGVGVYFPIELQKGEAEGEYLFRDLRGRERETLALFYRNLLSGRMTSTTEMISALDSPVDLVPMNETASERSAAEAGQTPRRARVLVNLLWYLLVFALVAAFLASVAWRRLQVVPVLAAHVSAPVVELRAPVGGLVRALPIAVGQPVAAGDILVQLEDQEALRLLAEAESAAIDSAQLLAAAETRLATHMQQATTARSAFHGGPERFDQGVSVNTGDFHDIRQRLEGEIASLQAEIARRQDRVAAQRSRAEATVMTAPAAGLITAHAVQPFEMVRSGEVLISYERDEPRSISVWVAPEHVLRVWSGMAAEVTHMQDGHAQRLGGTLTRLGTEGRGSDQLILAEVTLHDIDAAASRRLLAPGQPVQVVLRQNSLSRWFGRPAP